MWIGGASGFHTLQGIVLIRLLNQTGKHGGTGGSLIAALVLL
jgi:hypothetical protein